MINAKKHDRLTRLCRHFFGVVCLSATSLSFAEVTVTGNALNAHFDGVTLESALAEIATATGIEIATSQALEQKLTVSYQQIPPEKLLKRLLHGYNAMYLQHPQTKQLNKVRIFATGKPPVIAQQAPAATGNEAQEENGKYYMTVAINGRPIKMLVDTGANTLALSAQIASQLGLGGDQATTVQTANGTASAYRTVIASVAMAGKELQNIQAIILPNLQENGLIGQNVLGYYRRVTAEGNMRFEAIDINLPNNNQPLQSPQTVSPLPADTNSLQNNAVPTKPGS